MKILTTIKESWFSTVLSVLFLLNTAVTSYGFDSALSKQDTPYQWIYEHHEELSEQDINVTDIITPSTHDMPRSVNMLFTALLDGITIDSTNIRYIKWLLKMADIADEDSDFGAEDADDDAIDSDIDTENEALEAVMQWFHGIFLPGKDQFGIEHGLYFQEEFSFDAVCNTTVLREST